MIGNDYVWQDFLLNYQLYKNVGDLFFFYVYNYDNFH